MVGWLKERSWTRLLCWMSAYNNSCLLIRNIKKVCVVNLCYWEQNRLRNVHFVSHLILWKGVRPLGVTGPMMSHPPKGASEKDCRLQSEHVRYLKNLWENEWKEFFLVTKNKTHLLLAACVYQACVVFPAFSHVQKITFNLHNGFKSNQNGTTQNGTWTSLFFLTTYLANPVLSSPTKAIIAPPTAVFRQPKRSVNMLTTGEQKKIMPMAKAPTQAAEE